MCFTSGFSVRFRRRLATIPHAKSLALRHLFQGIVLPGIYLPQLLANCNGLPSTANQTLISMLFLPWKCPESALKSIKQPDGNAPNFLPLLGRSWCGFLDDCGALLAAARLVNRSSRWVTSFWLEQGTHCVPIPKRHVAWILMALRCANGPIT